MNATHPIPPLDAGRLSARRQAARRNAAIATDMMAECRLCARDCGVDRSHGPAGACAAPAQARMFDFSVDWSGEAGLAPCAIVSLSGCNLSCAFCIVARESQNALLGEPLEASAVAACIDQQTPQIQSFSVLGGEPTIHLPSVLDLVSQVSVGTPFVWKTNACASEAALPLIADVADVVLADFKFGNDACARRLAAFPRYMATVQMNLRFWRERGTPLIVRHLLMPGHLDCCLQPIVDWMARELPDATLSLMPGYRPTHRAASMPDLARRIRPDETQRATDMVRAAGVALHPWVTSPPPAAAVAPAAEADDIWIDATGCIHGLAANGPLAACLRNLQKEFHVGA
jgi:putative pyruvate formate lyase activating enzyme